MTAPALVLERFGIACLLGVALGIWYGFLRPIRPRALGDLLFLPAAAWAGIVLGFGVCEGDLRWGYYAGLFVGGFAWELTIGKWLRPVFFWFWSLWRKIFVGIGGLFQKIFRKPVKIAKKYLHMGKNRVQ